MQDGVMLLPGYRRKTLRKTTFGNTGLVTKSLDYSVTTCIHVQLTTYSFT